ncbi:MAG TPA: VanZ family protein [Gemmatimonadales bacterium]|nr:VanZ family protein [Gemmatimonadales bacterium]
MGRFLACAGLIFIAATTLVPIPQQELAARLTPWWCLICGDHGGQDVINNVLLFIPFALGLRLAGLPLRAVVVTGGLVSLSVELLQWSVVPGRDASLSDVVTNTLGSLVGAMVASYRVQLLRPSKRAGVRLATCWGALWLMIQLAGALLLQPWAPAEELRGVWARRVFGHPRFDGQVLSATLSGVPIPTDSQPVTPEMEQHIQSGRFDLQLRLRSAQSGKWSSVVEVLGPLGSVVAVEANRGDLAFQPPMRSSLFRLGRPALRIPGALHSPPGTELTLVARDQGSSLQAEWTSSDSSHLVSQALGPSLGWSLLAPFRYTYGRETSLLTMAWLTAWLLPLGYWTRHVSRRPFLSWGAALLLVALGLAWVPLLTGYPPAPFSEWLAALLGLTAGAAGSRSTAYFEARCDSLSTRESC